MKTDNIDEARGPTGEVKELGRSDTRAPPAAVADVEATGRIQAASDGRSLSWRVGGLSK